MSGDSSLEQASMIVQIATCIGSASSLAASAIYLSCKHSLFYINLMGWLPGSETIKRTCHNIIEYITMIDNVSFKRRYQMDKSSSYKLLDIISPHLPPHGSEQNLGSTPNGPITHEAQLSMALNFCHCDPLDIAFIHGVCSYKIMQPMGYCGCYP